MAVVTVTGGTGYIGRALIEQLVASGHTVTALARPQSRGKVPAGATIVGGSPLQSEDVARALSPGGTLVLLVGTPHPSPSKAAQFQDIDLASVRVLREFLQDMAEHPTRAWWVADYEADANLPWRSTVHVTRTQPSPAP